jgi:hypothetical protein
MHKHWWHTVEQGMGIRCDKCDTYANIMNPDFDEIEESECEVSEENYEEE